MNSTQLFRPSILVRPHQSNTAHLHSEDVVGSAQNNVEQCSFLNSVTMVEALGTAPKSDPYLRCFNVHI